MSKKEKKVKEPKQAKPKKEVYIPKTGIMGNATDYHVYNMSFTEKVIGFVVGGGGAAVVLFLFFESIVLSVISCIIIGMKAIPIYQKMLLNKRKKNLLFQFKDMLEALTSSYSAGKNTRDAFLDTLNDLRNMYGEDADIVNELKIIVSGMDNNINVENLLLDFAERSGIDDVESFADVFEVSLRQGADIKNIIATTRDVISDKVDMELEMTTMMAGNKNELNVILIMPLILTVALRGMSGDTFGNSSVNIMAKVVAIVIFVAAYAMGQKITDIKI